jgi:hypothetical protein
VDSITLASENGNLPMSQQYLLPGLIKGRCGIATEESRASLLATRRGERLVGYRPPVKR